MTEVDKLEDPRLRVPKSALDGCKSGFTAADDARVKASTQFFDDTALMALLCRHDRVLWIVNMCSADEKQHYYHQRIYTLDRQVHQFDKDSMAKLGQWLLRRLCHCQNKRHAAEAILLDCGQSDEVLRQEWAAQVAAQTKPLPCRSNSR
ncbi:hypothetical protein DXG01_007271 [Tephrocybe rancida]|nr:hypothetical protein DXG01_007271 [Tephrocybe rancida]